jgi:hypothetical protein
MPARTLGLPAVRVSTDYSASLSNPAMQGWEISVAKWRNVVLMSGNNTYAAYSSDGGNTFTIFYPYGNLPANEPVCCDQQVIYAPSINRFVLVFQTDQPNGNGQNRYRLMVTSPAALVASGGTAWTYWDITPAWIFQQGTTNWFDYPDIAVNDHSLFLTWNLQGSGKGVVAEMPLSTLADGTALSGQFALIDGGGLRLAQHMARGEFLGQVSGTSSINVIMWPDASNSWYSWRLPVTTIATSFSSQLPAPNSSYDWLGGGSKQSTRMVGAAWAGQILWFSWSAGNDQTFSQPHIEMLQVDPYTVSKIAERYIYNQSFAFSYPSLSANGGLLGMSFSWGGGIYPVRTGIGLLTADETSLLNMSNPGVGSGGHYSTIRESWPSSTEFVAGEYFQTRTDTIPYYNHPQFFEFGP